MGCWLFEGIAFETKHDRDMYRRGFEHGYHAGINDTLHPSKDTEEEEPLTAYP